MKLEELDWSKPFEGLNGILARAIWPASPDDVVFVEFNGEAGRWAYNYDGTPLAKNAFMPRLRNVVPNVK